MYCSFYFNNLLNILLFLHKNICSLSLLPAIYFRNNPDKSRTNMPKRNSFLPGFFQLNLDIVTQTNERLIYIPCYLLNSNNQDVLAQYNKQVFNLVFHGQIELNYILIARYVVFI